MVTIVSDPNDLKTEYQGLSTDTKPTNCVSGSTFYEKDTKLGWLFDENDINPTTSNGWWEV